MNACWIDIGIGLRGRVKLGTAGWLLAVLLMTALPGCSGSRESAGSAAPGKPNIVLIIMDTLRDDQLSCYGFPKETSPEFDRFAREGVQFVHVVAQCSWTRPSIGSMLTSRYPCTLGLYDEELQILPDRFVTLAEALRQNGYRTLGITANPHINVSYNFHQGFDHYVDSHVVFGWMPVDSGQVSKKTHRLKSAPQIFREVLDFAAAAGQGPTYVQLNVMEMHEYREKKERSLIRREFSVFFPEEPNKHYLQSLRQLSSDVAGFIAELCALPGWENTLFVLTSDHGQGLDSHPNVWHAQSHGDYLYESQVMVPMIFYHPGSTLPAQVIDRHVRLLDMMPTILDYVDAALPDSLTGISLMPLINDPEVPMDLPDYFVTETLFQEVEKLGVYAGEWKYFDNRDYESPKRGVRDQGVNRHELQRFGVTEDGRQTDEIANHPETAERLRAHLAAWEACYPRVAPRGREEPISEREREQLRSIGYLR
ncbi:MAG: sulfatase [Candidatus Eisenbacteria sp.]|nr:sulfatase [Candidatus Eisenbacteria bacterium]